AKGPLLPFVRPGCRPGPEAIRASNVSASVVISRASPMRAAFARVPATKRRRTAVIIAAIASATSTSASENPADPLRPWQRDDIDHPREPMDANGERLLPPFEYDKAAARAAVGGKANDKLLDAGAAGSGGGHLHGEVIRHPHLPSARADHDTPGEV